MSIVLIDGFDAYGDADRDLNRKPNYYAIGAISQGSGADTPWGTGKSIGFGQVQIGGTIPQLFMFWPYSVNSPPTQWSTEITIGFAYKYDTTPTFEDPTLSNVEMLMLGEYTWPQSYRRAISMNHFSDGSFGLWVNDSTGDRYLFTMPPSSFTYDSWDYWEVSLVISDTVGKVRIDRNGERLCDLSGVNTKPDVTLDSGRIAWAQIAGASTTLLDAYKWYDDLYLGSEFTDILGPQKVITLRPDGPATSSTSPVPTTWLPSTETSPPGSPPVENYEMVDDLTLDNDTTYVYTETVGAEDIYTLEDLPPYTKVISAVQQTVFARKDETEVHTIAPILESGSTKLEGDLIYLPPYYRGATGGVLLTNPDTGVAWTETDINNLKIGHVLKE